MTGQVHPGAVDELRVNARRKSESQLSKQAQPRLYMFLLRSWLEPCMSYLRNIPCRRGLARSGYLSLRCSTARSTWAC